jgi:hypothetical protein
MNVDRKLNDDEREVQWMIAPIEREFTHEPDAGFEARMWQRIEPRLVRRAPVSASWQWLAAAAVLVLAAFVAGRYTAPAAPPGAFTSNAANQAPAAERVLLIDLGGHLDLAEMTLVEFDSMPIVDAMVRARAEDLIAANRLYRGTAMTTGDAGVARVLDELERTLIEIATAPPDAAAAELADLRERIGSEGLVLKLRVMRDVLQDRAPIPDRRREDTTL